MIHQDTEVFRPCFNLDLSKSMLKPPELLGPDSLEVCVLAPRVCGWQQTGADPWRIGGRRGGGGQWNGLFSTHEHRGVFMDCVSPELCNCLQSVLF